MQQWVVWKAFARVDGKVVQRVVVKASAMVVQRAVCSV